MKKAKSLQSRLLRLRYALFCLGKALRFRKKIETIGDTTAAVKDKDTFTVINDEGKEVVCNVLLTFDNADESRHYIVYTDMAKDENGNVQVYASMYDPQHGDQMELLPIETAEEWEAIEDMLTDIQEKIRKGQPIESDRADEGVEEEDEILESLPVAIGKRLSDWSEKLRFPVGALLPYIPGIVIFCLVRTDYLPIWADAIFVFIELLLMKVSYDDIENTHFATSWIITVYLYIANLMFLLDPLMLKLFPNTARVTFEPWGFRGLIIVVVLFFIMRTCLQKKKRRRA